MKQKIMDIQKSLFIGWFPKMAHNGWVFVSGFALHNVQFKGQMLVANLLIARVIASTVY